jgi:hypothetical protein
MSFTTQSDKAIQDLGVVNSASLDEKSKVSQSKGNFRVRSSAAAAYDIWSR